MKLARVLTGALGVGVLLISLMFMAMAMGDLLGYGKGETETPVLIGLVLFFAGTGVCGAWMTRMGFTTPPSPDDAPTDRGAQIRIILNLAKASQGDVTLLQVATETALSIDQSRVLLEDLVSQGLAQMHIDEQGVVLYDFPDLRSGPQNQLPA
ncbi:MAG: hypothetical protein CVV27_07530 [Candidatus Melainabacteria bacterium HGW-Melainabacteria-1]|nr:MAG: hypothetical protein CVV27_07530 [Candidatus Melainabacteria bacterium HGW-Melainabacteria-1]